LRHVNVIKLFETNPSIQYAAICTIGGILTYC
jgi:hypothetical protein